MGALGSVWTARTLTSAALFVISFAAAALAYQPLADLVRRQERMYDRVLRGRLLLDIRPRTATLLTAVGMALLALLLGSLTMSLLGAAVGLGVGAAAPWLTVRLLARRRLRKLEDQLVGGIQSLASGVRAGLSLVQSMSLVARDEPAPLRQEFTHLLREYEYGVPLEEAMANAAQRIGSGDFRLLFAALETHRQRGGDLGETLDRIAASVREIQRLEKRVRTLTAQGRASARWLGAMPAAVLAILYLAVDRSGVVVLFTDTLGKLIVLAVVLLNIAGFLWIRKIVSVDV
jgi:tight adherence protein B